MFIEHRVMVWKLGSPDSRIWRSQSLCWPDLETPIITTRRPKNESRTLAGRD